MYQPSSSFTNHFPTSFPNPGICFVPLEPGQYIILIKKSPQEVPVGQITIFVEAAEPENAVGTPCHFPLEFPELSLPGDLPRLTSTLKRPGSTTEEAIKLRVLSDNTLSASFIPKSPGEHLISVKKRGRHLTGSPFSVNVTASEPANQIGKPVGAGLEKVPAKDLPRLEAGLQRPGSEIEEPITVKQNSDDTLSVNFIPREVGVHKVHVRKDKIPLADSPYLVNVAGKDSKDTGDLVKGVKQPGTKEPVGEVVHPVQDVRSTEEIRPVGRTCDFEVEITGVVLPGDFKKLKGTLERPNSKKEEPVTLQMSPDNTLGKPLVLL